MSDKLIMGEKTIEIKGKQISEQTIIEALKKHCSFDDFDESKAPVFSKTDDRLIVKMTDKVQKTFRNAVQFVERNEYFSIEPNGYYGAYHLGMTWKEAKDSYGVKSAKPLFSDKYLI